MVVPATPPPPPPVLNGPDSLLAALIISYDEGVNYCALFFFFLVWQSWKQNATEFIRDSHLSVCAQLCLLAPVELIVYTCWWKFIKIIFDSLVDESSGLKLVLLQVKSDGEAVRNHGWAIWNSVCFQYYKIKWYSNVTCFNSKLRINWTFHLILKYIQDLLNMVHWYGYTTANRFCHLHWCHSRVLFLVYVSSHTLLKDTLDIHMFHLLRKWRVHQVDSVSTTVFGPIQSRAPGLLTCPGCIPYLLTSLCSRDGHQQTPATSGPVWVVIK